MHDERDLRTTMLTPVQSWTAELVAGQHSLLHPTGVGGAVDGSELDGS